VKGCKNRGYSIAKYADVVELDGKDLMSKVKLNSLHTISDRHEQEGFKLILMGVMVGIKNPKDHDQVVQTDPYKTLE
jgi:hypothetical protein